MDHRGWGQDGLQRTRVTVGERVCGVLQCPAEGRTAGWGDLLHTPGGQRCDRKLETPLQHRPPAWVSGLQASGSGGVCARLHGLAGCAIPTGFAGQAPRSTPTNHALTFTSDHPMGADQARAVGFEIRNPQRFAQNMARLVEETGKAATILLQPHMTNPSPLTLHSDLAPALGTLAQ